jgi:hypothetical protein
MYRRPLTGCDVGLRQVSRWIASGHVRPPCGFFQKFVDECLVRFVPLCGEAPELGEQPGGNTDRDELFRISSFGAPNPEGAL